MNKQSDLIRTALEGTKDLINANTVLGAPLCMENGVTIIPVSQVAVGLASGGLDYFGKNQPNCASNDPEKFSSFGGAGGTGVSVTPIGFLVIKASGTVELLTVDAASNRPTAVSIIESVIDILERSPDIAERIKAMIMTFKTEETPVSPELSE
jgi:sporulation protein YtfJ